MRSHIPIDITVDEEKIREIAEKIVNRRIQKIVSKLVKDDQLKRRIIHEIWRV